MNIGGSDKHNSESTETMLQLHDQAVNTPRAAADMATAATNRNARRGAAAPRQAQASHSNGSLWRLKLAAQCPKGRVINQIDALEIPLNIINAQRCPYKRACQQRMAYFLREMFASAVAALNHLPEIALSAPPST